MSLQIQASWVVAACQQLQDAEWEEGVWEDADCEDAGWEDANEQTEDAHV